MAAFSDYVDKLASFDQDHKLGIFEAGHDEMSMRARQFDCIYKPCGAGGGDLGVVLATDPSAIDGFCDAAEAAGFRALDLQMDAAGLQVEAEPKP